MHYRVLIPSNYEKDDKPYPVLYLLHGLYGDYTNWDSLTGLAEYAHALPLLIVMPDADNSWYSNSATVPGDRFEEYIIKDVIGEIDGQYRTLAKRESRSIAGLSMGGYAAMKFALRYPDMFAFAGSLSGAFDAARNLAEKDSEFRTKLVEVFGAAGSKAREENDIFILARSADVPKMPYLYVECGAGDDFLASNRQFVEQLQRRGFRYEYHELPGGHGWDYWNEGGQRMLGALARIAAPIPLDIR
jgi:S-formylglutathione hydrolase FrmB